MTALTLQAVHAALFADDPRDKAQRSIALYAACRRGERLAAPDAADSERLARDRDRHPGHPARPVLVDPKALKRRGVGSEAGRIALLHSLAHIEFNAINLALDAVWRFTAQPDDYVEEWLRVARDEAEHFTLLAERLVSLGSEYGAHPAHDGLWDMARRTEHDILVRMALVPRILEARGLDVAPPMIERLEQAGDHASAAILQRIYTDEITHVAVGNRWFRHVCDERGLDGAEVFRDLLAGGHSVWLRGPYNRPARLEAGFTEAELDLIRDMEAEYRRDNAPA